MLKKLIPDKIDSPSRRQFVALAVLASVFGYPRSTGTTVSTLRIRGSLTMIDGWVLKESDLSNLDMNVY